MADISSWSPVDASNNASPPDGWPENMQPSAVNDCARAIMGAIRRNYDQIITGTFAFTNITASGTVTAGYIHSIGDVHADNAVTAPNIYSTGDVHADNAVTALTITVAGTLTATTLTSTGNITANGTVTAGLVHSTGDVTADNAVTAPQLTSTGNITAASGTVAALHLAGTDASVTNTLQAGALVSNGNITAASGSVAALHLAGTDASVTNALQAGSLVSNSIITAIGAVNAAAFNVVSDHRLKEDIEPSPEGLREVLRLHPVSFRRLHAQGREVGFVAQDVRHALPQAVASIDLNGEAMLAINDMPILAALVNAIKNLSARLDSLEAR